MFHRRASFLPRARSPPERRECGRRKSRPLPAFTRLKKRLRALLHGASAPPPNPVPRQPQGVHLPGPCIPRNTQTPEIIPLSTFRFSTRNLALPGLKNMSKPSYLNRLDCALSYRPWARSNRAFFNSYICLVAERAQSRGKAFQVCAILRPFLGAQYTATTVPACITRR